jgi:hypothetical protein
VIYGVNFDQNGDTTVVVGDKECSNPVVISSKLIECTLPPWTGIGSNTVDITVSNGVATSTFRKGYRYIDGVPTS